MYYTSVIFPLGAEFSQVYSEIHGRGIRPTDTAVKVKEKEIEKDEDRGKVEEKEK